MVKKLVFGLIPAFLAVCISQTYALTAQEVRSIYIKAIESLANNNLDDSEANLRIIISIPRSGSDADALERYQSKAYYFLGDIYFMKLNYEQSVSYYRVVIQKYPDADIYSKALYKLGRTLVLNGQNREAVSVFNDYISQFEKKEDLGDSCYYWLGRAYMGLGEYYSALSIFQSVLYNYPNTALAYDIRDSINKLTDLIRQEKEAAPVTNTSGAEIAKLKAENEKLAEEKKMLQRLSELLVMKQRLLEIKAEKVELYKKTQR